jgi:hypothetical protein
VFGEFPRLVGHLLFDGTRISAATRIEQNFGPHIEQKCAVLADSAGRVSSWNARAVSGSSGNANWSC